MLNISHSADMGSLKSAKMGNLVPVETSAERHREGLEDGVRSEGNGPVETMMS